MIREVLFPTPNVVEVRTRSDVAPGPGQVKVQTALCGISHGTELNLLRGTAAGFHRRWDPGARVFSETQPLKRYPVEPGYECVGGIVSVGEGVQGIPLGRLVWLDRPHKEAHVVEAAEAREGLLPIGMTPESGIFCALARVALGAVHDAAIQVGDRVAVVGLGTIGLLAVQLALRNGASEVFAIDRFPLRLEAARGFGAIPIQESDPNLHARIRNGVRPMGVDVAIETSGAYAGLQLAIACCAIAATVVTVSTYQGAAGDLRLGEEFHRNRITLLSSMTVNGAPHRAHPRWDLDRLNETARALLAEGKLDIQPLLTHEFPFQDAAAAYDLIQRQPEACIRVALRGNAAHKAANGAER